VSDRAHHDAALRHALFEVRDSLAVDGRVGELGLDVCVERDHVVVRGAISTEARRAQVEALVRDVLATHGIDLPVDNATHVPGAGEPSAFPEEL
jgi:hypothetical protein